MSNETETNQAAALSTSWKVCFAALLSAAVVLAPEFALAQEIPDGTNTPFGTVFCTVVGWFLSNTGKGLATLAVIIIGIGALLGKVSWGMALIVGTGVAIVFGAIGIVDAIGAGAEDADCVVTSDF